HEPVTVQHIRSPIQALFFPACTSKWLTGTDDTRSADFSKPSCNPYFQEVYHESSSSHQPDRIGSRRLRRTIHDCVRATTCAIGSLSGSPSVDYSSRSQTIGPGRTRRRCLRSIVHVH